MLIRRICCSTRFFRPLVTDRNYFVAFCSSVRQWQGISFIRVPTLASFRLASTSRAAERRRQHEKWDSKLDEFKQFVRENGHARVPQSHESLGIWVNANRKEYKKFLQKKDEPCWMTQERVKILEEAGFVWDVDEAKWMDNYKEMCSYHREHGHW